MKTLRDRSLPSDSAPTPERRPVKRGRGSRPLLPVDEGELGSFLFFDSAAWTFLGVTLGVFVSRKFFILPLAVALTLGQELLRKRLEQRYGR